MIPLSPTVIYLGDNSLASTSRHRAHSLRRLGCKVTVVDPQILIGTRSWWQSSFEYRSGYSVLQRRLLRALKSWVDGAAVNPDFIWIDSGELFGPRVLRWLKSCFPIPFVLYNVDDPTGARDQLRFQRLRESFSLYDLCVFVRSETALEALALGAQQVLTVHRSYDEIEHSPPRSLEDYSPEPVVSFIGTLIPGEPRDLFLLAMHKAGLPIRLIGNAWQRSPHWPLLKAIHQGPGRSGAAYAQALASAKVSIGFLSHQNRDLVTTRSFEVPACGGLLCAERTSEHQLLYEEGLEAVFWSSTDECLQHCRRLLSDSQLSARIRSAGLKQVNHLGVGNDDICRRILLAL